MKNKNTVSIIAGVVVMAGVAAFFIFGEQLGQSTQNGNAVALVNGEEILEADFEARVAQQEQILTTQGQVGVLEDGAVREQFEASVLDQMIAEKLFAQKAVEQGISVSEEEVDAQYQTLYLQLGGEESFNDQLAAVGISQGDFRENVETQLLIQKYLDANVDTANTVASEEEVSQLYEQFASTQENPPALEEIRDQIEFEIIQQKEGQIIESHAQSLRSEAEVEVLI